MDFETTGSPVNLLNIVNKDDKFFVNETSSVVQASGSEMTFERSEPNETTTQVNGSYQSAKDVTLKEIPILIRSQKVSESGIIKIGDKPPKEVTKRDGSKRLVKEDCIVEDATGSSEINIWEDLIAKMKNGKAYKITNLAIKKYSGNTFLGATKETNVTESDVTLDEVKGPKLLSNHENEIVVEEFEFVDKINVFLKCQIKACNRKMPFSVGASVFKCQACGTTQKKKRAEKGMSARLCVKIDDKELWLTALTEVIETLTSAASVSTNATTDEIAAALLGLENTTIKYDTRSKFILKAAQ